MLSISVVCVCLLYLTFPLILSTSAKGCGFLSSIHALVCVKFARLTTFFLHSLRNVKSHFWYCTIFRLFSFSVAAEKYLKGNMRVSFRHLSLMCILCGWMCAWPFNSYLVSLLKWSIFITFLFLLSLHFLFFGIDSTLYMWPAVKCNSSIFGDSILMILCGWFAGCIWQIEFWKWPIKLVQVYVWLVSLLFSTSCCCLCSVDSPTQNECKNIQKLMADWLAG